MPHYFSKASVVEDVFAITGRGCIICGEFSSNLKIKIGTPLELRRAAQVVFSSTVSGIDIPTLEQRMFCLWVRGLEKTAVQLGDEIWLEDAAFVQLGSSH